MIRNTLLMSSLLLGTFCIPIYAADLSIEVLDSTGAPVENAVVYAEPDAKIGQVKSTAIIEQRSKQFNPLVSVVQTGTDITFPNFDSVRHHVYSFSPAKTFELKLYSGVPANPVKFDKAGTIVLGCNIHDYMVAFIKVVDTPYFTKTNNTGQAVLRNLPAGNYILKAWHYAQAKENETFEKSIAFKEAEKATLNIALKPFMLPASK